MTAADTAKQTIERYWAVQAATFDDQFLHSVASEGERCAWEAILDRLAPPGRALEVLDVGCGTGFLALLFAERGHRVTGSDLAPEMVAAARAKAQTRGAAVTYLVDDAEAIGAPDASYDLVVSRHLYWTLPHPDQALTEWLRVIRPGGRVAILDGEWNRRPSPESGAAGMRHKYGEAVIAALPNFGGAPARRVAAQLGAHGLQNVQTVILDDLVAAQRECMTEEQRARATFVRYLVYGDRPR